MTIEEVNGQVPSPEIVFVLRYDPTTRGVAWQISNGFPADALINGLELAKAMFVSQQLQGANQQPIHQNPVQRITYPDGTPFKRND